MTKYNLEFLEEKLGPFQKEYQYPTKPISGFNLIYVESETKEELTEKIDIIKKEQTPGYIWGYVKETKSAHVTRSFGENRIFNYNPNVFKNRTEYVKLKLDVLKNLNKDSFNELFDQKAVLDKFYEKLWYFRKDFGIEIRDKNGISNNNALMAAQHIMDRIIFTYFLCEKNLVKLNGENAINSKTLFISIAKMPDPWKCLKNLFFEQFAKKNSKKLILGKNTQIVTPYLNGGLFRPKNIEGIPEDKLIIKFDKAQWLELFDHLNKYTWIIEDEIKDPEGEYEGNLTPEIMGHIYEKFVISLETLDEVRLEQLKITKKGDLLKGNKKIGAYYTPEHITDYICRNTMVPYLFEKLDISSEMDMDAFLENSDPKTLKRALKILNNTKVCDPAAGSGAFLIKAGEILLEYKIKILLKLNVDYVNRYALKKDIIIKNLYGVDIQEGAIEICKLRLWLWLMSSSQGGNIEPLPNIEYNFRVGNTLIGWLNENIVQISLNNPLTDVVKGILKGLIAFSDEEDEKSIKKAEYYLKGFNLDNYIESYYILYKLYRKAHGNKAENLRDIIEIIRSSIYESINPAFRDHLNEMIKPKFNKKNPPISEEAFKLFNTFHWRVDFGHIIKNGGFDIIIGNPPYVRADNDNERYLKQREWLKNIGLYVTLYEKWDFFVPFIERGLNLITDDGYFSFIISNSYNTSKYADKSKKHVYNNYNLKKIDFFKNIIVFKGIGVESVILTIQNNKKHEKTTRILHTDRFENLKELEPSDNIDNMFRISKGIDFNSKFHNTELLGDICFVSVGMVLNAHEKKAKGEFKKDDLISDLKTDIYKKPYIEAKDIERYRINRIRYLEWDTERCPSKIRRPTFPELYVHPKIIRGRTTEGIYDETGLVCNDSPCIFVLHHLLKNVSNRSINNSIKKWTLNTREELEETSLNFDIRYILFVLNSKFAKFYLNTIRRHRIEYYFYPDDFKKLPIKKISLEEQAKYGGTVEKITSLNKKLVNELSSFKKYLNSDLSIPKPSQKLESYYTLSFNEFLNELKDQKADVKNMDLIKDKFKKSVEIVIPLIEKITKIDYNIDKEVYQLYELNKEEIKIIEETFDNSKK